MVSSSGGRVRLLSSLTNRIFLATSAAGHPLLGFTVYFVNARVSTEAEAELRRGLAEAARSSTAPRDAHRDFTPGAPHRRPAEAQGGGGHRRSAHRASHSPRITGSVRARTCSWSGGGTGRCWPRWPTREATPIRRRYAMASARRAAVYVQAALPRRAAGGEVPISTAQPSPEMLGTPDNRLRPRRPLGASLGACHGDGHRVRRGWPGARVRAPRGRGGRCCVRPDGGAEGISTVTFGADEFIALSAGRCFPRAADAPGITPAPEVPITLTLRSRTERLRLLRAHPRRASAARP